MVLKDEAERLEKNAPDYGEQLFRLSMMHKARLELIEANEIWVQVCSSPTAKPESRARAFSEIATLHHLSGDHATALEMLGKSRKIQETSQVWVKLAALAVEEGDFKAGKEYMEKAAKCITNGPEAKNERADYNFHLSAIRCLEAADLTVARDLLDSAIADVPDYGLAYMQLGVVLFRMGHMEKAEEALEQACLMVPELAEVHNFHGEVLMSENKRDEALRKFLEAGNVDEKCSLPLLNRGVMLMSNEAGEPPSDEDLEKAIELFNQAVEADPTNEIAFIHRASYYCHVGDLKTALENYDRAIELTKSVPYLTEYLCFRHMCAADLAAQGSLKH
jgi:Tfp pilus assembly protein PilF